MSSSLDPGAQDPDLGYMVMQLRHLGAPVEQMELVGEGLPAERCCYSGLTVPECSCASCTRDLIMRYRPGGYSR